MDLMLNYAVSYGSPLAEMLIAKLTCFYNKAILKKPTRMLILLPLDRKLEDADLHKTLFDEIVSVKFDPSSSKFWQSKKLYKIFYFIHTLSDIQYRNVYIDQGKIFKDLVLPIDFDICASSVIKDPDFIRHVNVQLNSYCDLPLLDDTQLVFYDFSIFSISDLVQSDFQKLIKQVAQSYPEYIDTKLSYAILSILSAHISQKLSAKIVHINTEPIDIDNHSLVTDFYTLI